MAKRTGVVLTDKLRRLAWSNRTTLALATAAVDVAYLVRKTLTGRPATARPELATATGGDACDLSRLDRYRSGFASLGGSFWDGAIVTWDVLLARQAALAVRGDLLEIGVLKGKSATLIALHARADESFVMVDPALRREAIDAVESIRSNNVFVRDVSQNLRGHEALAGREASFRWLHIDGEHSGPAVTNDLEIAEALLAPHGIICLDDFFTPAYPQITAAVFAFLARRRERLQLFLIGYNKGYICRTEDAGEWLVFLRDRAGREYARRDFPVTLWKTANPADTNCFGVTPRQEGAGYKGPDWAPDTLPI